MAGFQVSTEAGLIGLAENRSGRVSLAFSVDRRHLIRNKKGFGSSGRRFLALRRFFSQS